MRFFRPENRHSHFDLPAHLPLESFNSKASKKAGTSTGLFLTSKVLFGCA